MNKSYPDLKWTNEVDHLLFDVGFSHACLDRAEQLLRELEGRLPVGDYLHSEIADMIQTLEELRHGRLQLRSQIYDNAAAALKKGRENE